MVDGGRFIARWDHGDYMRPMAWPIVVLDVVVEISEVPEFASGYG
jgi:hypothetical protein